MRDPDILVRSDFDPALAWMVVVSLLLHAAVVLLVVFLPGGLFHRPPQLASYTVELTAGNELGGTNVGGSGGSGNKKISAAPAPPPPKPPAAKAPEKAAAAEPVKPPEPPKPAEAPKPVEPPKAVEPPQPVQKAIPIEKPKEPPKAEKPPEPVKPQQQAKAVAPIEKPKPPPPPPKVEAKPETKPVPKPSAAPAKPDASAKVAPAKPDGKAKPSVAAAGAAKATPGVDEAAQQRDRMIAAAIQRRADAVKQVGSGGNPGVGGGTGTGPASIGPGQGAGGIVKGIEWVMYMRQLETKVKENWVWTVKDGSRIAEVHFQVQPTGEVVNVKISKSSGDPSFDASVERAVNGASPLPQPPERYRNEFGSDGVLLTFNETESRF